MKYFIDTHDRGKGSFPMDQLTELNLLPSTGLWKAGPSVSQRDLTLKPFVRPTTPFPCPTTRSRTYDVSPE